MQDPPHRGWWLSLSCLIGIGTGLAVLGLVGVVATGTRLTLWLITDAQALYMTDHPLTLDKTGQYMIYK